MNFLWDFVLGPLLAFLPKRWRQRSILAREVQWQRAGTVSGIYEMAAAVVALGYWYMFEMSRLSEAGVQAAADGKLGPGVTDTQVGGAALVIFALHPLTWLLFCFFLEGGVRLCSAAFGEMILGTWPFYVVERLIFWTTRPQEAHFSQTVSRNTASFAGAIRERAQQAMHKELPDELFHHNDGADDLLEIYASRRKQDWDPPKIARIGEAYYHLEKAWTRKGARPFCYELRRLAAGVPSRKVLVYHRPQEQK